METNYYQEMLKQVESNIENKKYEEAYGQISEELAMPYIPSDILLRLETLKKEVEPFLNREKVKRILSPEEVLEALKTNSELTLQAIDTLSSSNIRNYLDVIQEYLDYELADRYIISLLFELCQQQQVTVPLTFTDKGVEYTIAPNQLNEVLDDEVLMASWALLSDLFENNNPSFLQMCREALVQYAYHIYPLSIEYSSIELVNMVVKYVYQASNDMEEWQKFIAVQQINADDVELLDI